MEKEMDDAMKQKLDAVLESVKEPETGLSVGEIGLVQKFRYVEKKKILYVYRNKILPSKGCCTIISNMLLATCQKDFLDALGKAFPELEIKIVVLACKEND